MITKDEEDYVAQAILSVQSIISETIVVDTGSTDRTVEILQGLGATVLHRAWDNDFSSPRNLSLSKATGDWILVLDADEAIAETELELLCKHTLNRSCCYQLVQRHYTNDHRLSEFFPIRGDYPGWERNYAGFFESSLIRLFPNHEGIEYRGRIHELVEASVRELNRFKVVVSPVRIQHYGHTPEVQRKKDKTKLYTPLGQAKLSDEPTNWQAYHELGIEQNRNGCYEESVLAFLKAVSMNPKYLPSWINMGYVLCEMGRYEEAATSLHTALDIDPAAHEAHCNLGVVYMRINKLQPAERHLRQAIKLERTYVNAYCNLGKTLAMTNRLSEAVNMLERALKIMPQCATAKADLGAIYYATKMWSAAEGYLEDAVRLDPNCSRALYHLGLIYKATERTQQAIAALKEFCRIERETAPAGTPPSRVVIQTELECELLKGI